MADDDLKKDVLRVLSETEETHERGQGELRKGLKFLQAGRDEGRLARELVEQDILNKDGLKLLKVGFETRNDAARVVGRQAQEVLGLYVLGSGNATVAVSTGVSTIIEMGQASRFAPLLERANAVLGYAEELDRVRAGLTRCGLDRVREDVNRSALSLVDESALAVQTPTLPESSSAVVTLRDGINRAIVDLFNRCEGQESGKSSNLEAKVRSIFRRARRIDLPDSHIEALCTLVEEKVRDMAGAKDKVTTRVSVLVLYQDRLRFLLALLDGVDEGKLTRR